DQQGGTQRADAHAGAGACRGWHPRQRRLSGPPGTCVRAAAARFVMPGECHVGRIAPTRAAFSTAELLEYGAQARRFFQASAHAFDAVGPVEHHRAALEPTVEAVVAEADRVHAGVAVVLEELNSRFDVVAQERGLLDDLA